MLPTLVWPDRKLIVTLKPSSAKRPVSRRKFIGLATASLAGAVALDAFGVEPGWLKINHVKIPGKSAGVRIVQFSDLHHKGDRRILDGLVNRINALRADYVCFTGDIVERREYLAEALAAFACISAPLFGVPGNHDYWSHIPFQQVSDCFASTGGAWLLNNNQLVANGRVNLIGVAGQYTPALMPLSYPGARNIVLMHYPAMADHLRAETYDLLMAGHSHGGQVRLPVLGALHVPRGVGRYELGMYQTKSGPLYVNAGIGYLSGVNLRFNCRPEITVFDV